MSERAREFLKHWKSEHIEVVPNGHRLGAAVRLVTKCREDATRAGIPAQELRSAAGNDMIRHILAGLEAASPSDEVEAEPRSITQRFLAHIPSALHRTVQNIIPAG